MISSNKITDIDFLSNGFKLEELRMVQIVIQVFIYIYMGNCRRTIGS